MVNLHHDVNQSSHCITTSLNFYVALQSSSTFLLHCNIHLWLCHIAVWIIVCVSLLHFLMLMSYCNINMLTSMKSQNFKSNNLRDCFNVTSHWSKSLILGRLNMGWSCFTMVSFRPYTLYLIELLIFFYRCTLNLQNYTIFL